MSSMTNGLSHPETQYEQKQGQLERHSAETKGRRLAHEERLRTLRNEREEAQKKACDHAGNIGLVYSAEDNNYYRITSHIPAPPKLELPTPPAAPTPPTAPRPSAADPRLAGAWATTLKVISWVLAVPVGAFVGYGIATLAGFPIQRVPAYLVAGIVVGIALVVGIKILFEVMWTGQGRQVALGKATPASLIGSYLLTAGLVLIEAFLGAQALVIYSQRTVFEASQAIPLALAFPLAVAISSAALLISAFQGYQVGRNSLTADDYAERDYQRQLADHAKLVQKAESEYSAQLSRWESERLRLEAEHRNLLDRSEGERAEMEHYRKSPDYQALLKYIGRVNTLNLQIQEAEKLLTSDSIERGHEKASLL